MSTLFWLTLGATLGAIVSIGFHVNAAETSPTRCQEKVIAFSTSNTCPKGAFLEFQSDSNGGRYIVCHCEQPINVIIQMSPSQDQLEPDELPTFETVPAPLPIEL